VAIITILSGKGGTGKSTLTMGLGSWVSRLKPDRNVLLIDGDLSVSTIRFKMCQRPRATLADVLAGRKPLSEAIHVCELLTPGTKELLYPNLAILPASMPDQNGIFLPPLRGSIYGSFLSVARKFDEMISELRKDFFLVLVDTPASISLEHVILTGIADGAIYVVEPAHESLEVATHASRDLKRLMRVRPIGVVLNNLPSGASQREWVKKAERIAPLLGVVPEDDRVRETFMHDIPVAAEYPDSPASQAMRGIAVKLLGITPKPAKLTRRFERAISELGRASS